MSPPTLDECVNAEPVTHNNNIRPTSEDARHGGVSNVKTILHVGGSSKRGEWRTDGDFNIIEHILVSPAISRVHEYVQESSV